MQSLINFNYDVYPSKLERGNTPKIVNYWNGTPSSHPFFSWLTRTSGLQKKHQAHCHWPCANFFITQQQNTPPSCKEKTAGEGLLRQTWHQLSSLFIIFFCMYSQHILYNTLYKMPHHLLHKERQRDKKNQGKKIMPQRESAWKLTSIISWFYYPGTF